MYQYRPKKASSNELLGRMLSHTTLTTQTVGHNHVLEVGGKLLDCKTEDVKEDHEKDVSEAVKLAEARSTRELRAALKRQKKELDVIKETALESQKQYYLRHIDRVFAQRDIAEEERTREMVKQFDKDKVQALAEQRDTMLDEKEKALQIRSEEVRRETMEEMKQVVKKEREDATILATELAEQKASEQLKMALSQCAAENEKTIANLQKLHDTEISELKQRLTDVERKYKHESAERRRVETDFEVLQEDYKRFLDNTGGKFHSDYLMKLRNYNRGLAPSEQSQKNRSITINVQSLFDKTNSTKKLVARAGFY